MKFKENDEVIITDPKHFLKGTIYKVELVDSMHHAYHVVNDEGRRFFIFEHQLGVYNGSKES